MKGVNFANTFSHKLLREADDTFCDASGFEKRAKERKRLCGKENSMSGDGTR